jgi:hypothetical protein
VDAQNQQTGAAGSNYGHEYGKTMIAALGGKKLNSRSNVFLLDGNGIRFMSLKQNKSALKRTHFYFHGWCCGIEPRVIARQPRLTRSATDHLHYERVGQAGIVGYYLKVRASLEA